MPGAGDPVAGQMLAGGRALLLLADPVSVSILRHLAVGPLRSMELLDRVEFVSRSTYFERMRALEELSLVSRRRRSDVPPIAECQLETAGERLLPVARRLERWLADAPQGPLELGDPYATATVKALAVAWGSTLLRWLAERPRSLVELERMVHVFGCRKLERIVRSLVSAGLVERVAIENRRPKPYGVTEWARTGAALLTAAMRWERREIPAQSVSISSVEAEGVMLLGVPLISLSPESSGSSALLVDDNFPDRESLGGAVVELSDGRPARWKAVGKHEPDRTALEADSWVRGPTSAWLGMSADPSGAVLRMGGDSILAENVIAALREVASVHHHVPVIPT
jgi:DNA-binding HxlR family transcriptional regulator